MNQQEEYKKVLSEMIHKQITILGPDITLAKVKNVNGIQVDQSGNVVDITGEPQAVLEKVINEFVELSGLIVRKTMESIIKPQVNHNNISTQETVEQDKNLANNQTLHNESGYSEDMMNTVNKTLSDLNRKQQVS